MQYYYFNTHLISPYIFLKSEHASLHTQGITILETEHALRIERAYTTNYEYPMRVVIVVR